MPRQASAIITYEEMEESYIRDSTLQTLIMELEQMKVDEASARQFRAEIDRSYKKACQTLNTILRRIPSQQRLIRNRRKLLMQRAMDKRVRELRTQIGLANNTAILD